MADSQWPQLPANGPELRALNRQDVTPDQARDIDRLYDELLADDKKACKQYPTPKH